MAITMKPKSKENKKRIQAINNKHLDGQISKLHVRSITEIVGDINKRMHG